MTIWLGSLALVGIAIWLFKPNKKGDKYEEIGQSIYQVMLKQNPKTTDDEARAFVFDILGEKEYKKLSLIQLNTIHERILSYLSLNDVAMNQYEMRRIVECEIAKEGLGE